MLLVNKVRLSPVVSGEKGILDDSVQLFFFLYLKAKSRSSFSP